MIRKFFPIIVENPLHKAWEHLRASKVFFVIVVLMATRIRSLPIDFNQVTEMDVTHSQIIDYMHTIRKRKTESENLMLWASLFSNHLGVIFRFQCSKWWIWVGFRYGPMGTIFTQREAIQGCTVFHSQFSWNNWGPGQVSELKNATFVQWLQSE